MHGLAGAYQHIMHFDDDFTHMDELSWAACEMFLATGDPQYQAQLEAWFPDPTDPATSRWGWVWMFDCYGNAIRDYATAVSSGRLKASQLDPAYLAKCITTITNCGNANLQWSQDNAYGSSFPDETKPTRTAGWYFSPEQAFDMVVAQLFNPNPAYVDAILKNLNYEGGCNPVNVTYVTGLGWKRQREIVDQYSENDRRVLPKDGVPISNLQEGFVWTFTYGYEMTPLCFPSDGAQTAPYPFYDRWCDFFNVTTEASTTDTTRSFATRCVAGRADGDGNPAMAVYECNDHRPHGHPGTEPAGDRQPPGGRSEPQCRPDYLGGSRPGAGLRQRSRIPSPRGRRTGPIGSRPKCSGRMAGAPLRPTQWPSARRPRPNCSLPKVWVPPDLLSSSSARPPRPMSSRPRRTSPHGHRFLR